MRMNNCGLACLLGCALIGVVGWGTSTVRAADVEVSSVDDLHGADVDSEHGAHGDGAHGNGHADADGHAAGGSTNPVTFDPDLAIVTALIFLALLAVLWKFAWGPVVAALDKREQTFAAQLVEAQRNQDESRRLMTEHETRLAGAAAEVKQMMDQARRDAEVQKQEMVERPQIAAAAEKDRAVREIHAAKTAALQDLAQKSVDTAVDLAGRIVRRQLNSDDHAKLVGDALDQFSQKN